MRKLQADIIYTNSGEPLNNGILVVDEASERIKEVAPEGSYVEGVEKKEGVFCPAFINAHCHLELSHLKGHIPEATGLVDFVRPIAKLRQEFTEEQIQTAIKAADEEMFQNGIIAVGDISNVSNSFAQKKRSNIHYHTFVECLGLSPQRALPEVERAKEVLQDWASEQHISLVPHAPYSVSKELFMGLQEVNTKLGQPILSIHNQESQAEQQLFESGTGDFVDFYKTLGIELSDIFQATGRPSIYSTIAQLSDPNTRLLLVHNTFTTKEDLVWANAQLSDLWWCFCPRANWYIERNLPDFKHFIAESSDRLVLGTDSLASNHSLSIWEEMSLIFKKTKEITFDELLGWATINGARFLNIDQDYGTLEAGKKAAIVWLDTTRAKFEKALQAKNIEKFSPELL